jgi:hypothetical protein
MSGIAFFIMLAGFAVLLIWYVLNVEEGQDGTAGWFRLREEAKDPDAPSLKRRVERPAASAHLMSVRQKAKAAHDGPSTLSERTEELRVRDPENIRREKRRALHQAEKSSVLEKAKSARVEKSNDTSKPRYQQTQADKPYQRRS